MIPLKIALRNVFRHRTRSLITLSAIAFGCTALIFVGGFFEDILWKLRESYIKAHTGHLQVYTKGYYEQGSAAPFDYLIEQPDLIISLISVLGEVDYVAKRIEFAGLVSTGETSTACLVQGIEPLFETAVTVEQARASKSGDLTAMGGSVMEAGHPLSDEDKFGVILGKGLAAAIGAQVGDDLIVLGHTVDGIMNALDVSLRGTFYTSAKAFDDHTLRMPLKTAQELLYTEGVLSLVVMLHDTDKTDAVLTRLRGVFQRNNMRLEVLPWYALTDFYVKTKDLFKRMFFVLKLVIAIIVILSIYNTMNMAVIERTREIGTLMALGTKQSGVVLLFLLEGGMLGFFGGLLGIGVGSLLTKIISWIGIPMPPPPGASFAWVSEPMIVPGVLVFCFFLSIATSLISSLLPARNAARMEVAEALRHG